MKIGSNKSSQIIPRWIQPLLPQYNWTHNIGLNNYENPSKKKTQGRSPSTQKSPQDIPSFIEAVDPKLANTVHWCITNKTPAIWRIRRIWIKPNGEFLQQVITPPLVPVWVCGFERNNSVFPMLGVTGLNPQFWKPKNFRKGKLQVFSPTRSSELSRYWLMVS